MKTPRNWRSRWLRREWVRKSKTGPSVWLLSDECRLQIFRLTYNNCVEMQCHANCIENYKRIVFVFRTEVGSFPKYYISVETNSIFGDLNHFALWLYHKQTNWPTKRFTDNIVIIFPSVCYLYVWILTMKGNIHRFPSSKCIVKTLSQVIMGSIIVCIVIWNAKLAISLNKLWNARTT